MTLLTPMNALRLAMSAKGPMPNTYSNTDLSQKAAPPKSESFADHLPDVTHEWWLEFN